MKIRDQAVFNCTTARMRAAKQWRSVFILALFGTLAIPRGFPQASAPSAPEARLKAVLERFPEADTNGDGVLSADEARAFSQTAKGRAAQAKRAVKGKDAMPTKGDAELNREGSLTLPDPAEANAREAPPHQTEMVAMRDGARLATDVYLPEGKGPWPAVVVRTPYDRQSRRNAIQSAGYLKGGYAYVIQDWRGLFGSEGKFVGLIPEEMQADGYDTIEWIARQPWCDGKVGITGGSGPGVAAKMAALANPPHLVAAVTSVAALRPAENFGINGGVLRSAARAWMAQRGASLSEWPKPYLHTFEDPRGFPTPSLEKPVQAAIRDTGGWFDIYHQSTLDDFRLLDNGRYRVAMLAKGHGADSMKGLEFPGQNLPDANPMSWFDYWLKGKPNGVMDTPPVRYFLMGETTTPGAPGNVWRQADRWPVPHTPRSFFLTKDGALRTAAPTTAKAQVAFEYDPRNPVPTIGGANPGENQGPMDQRPLHGRADIVRFVTEPLAEPLEIVGRVYVELFFQTDVPDTTLMAKLINVAPDGRESLMLDSAIMARYWNGFDKPAPLESGKVYKLTIDLFSTALVFNTGHRIALHVAGSNAPRYEVHPNSFEPANSLDAAPVAHNAVHVSASHPSRLILPVIAAGETARAAKASGQ